MKKEIKTNVSCNHSTISSVILFILQTAECTKQKAIIFSKDNEYNNFFGHVVKKNTMTLACKANNNGKKMMDHKYSQM